MPAKESFSYDQSSPNKSSFVETKEYKRFHGFRNTPFLWQHLLEGLQMYESTEIQVNDYPEIDVSSHIRLGKLIEQFVSFEMEQDESIEILKSNVQIFRDRITIGELDCLIRKSAINIHLEIVYKFYLYDPSIPLELDRWIGPNRKDSLVQKLRKLTDKQLPLLYSPETANTLNELNIKASEFQQQVYFKAQLFVPLNPLEAEYPLINKACIQGFYIRYSELSSFSSHSFFIPSKLDWLAEPHSDVEWISNQSFQLTVSKLLSDQKSPLCWMKSPDGEIQKFFMVWWE